MSSLYVLSIKYDKLHQSREADFHYNLLLNMNIVLSCSPGLKSRCDHVNGFLSPSQDECFVYNSDLGRDWETARSYCWSKGLQIAAPRHHNSIWLRKHILDNYGIIYYTIHIFTYHTYI